MKNVREGMKVEIHSFDADMFLGEVFAKVDGRTTQWYKNGIKERPGERVILLSLFLAYALELCWIIMKGKQKLEERKNRYILLLSGYIRDGIICINGHIRVETARVRKAMV